MGDLWMFVGALAIAYLMPGPDMVLLLQTGASQGRGLALAAAIGLAAARAAHVALAAFGLAALLGAAPWAFDLVRLGGAAYLVWLGIAILRADPGETGRDGPGTEGKPGGRRAAVLRGFLTNITNPKALLFCSVLLPQFVLPAEGGVAGQFVRLGAVLVATGIAFDALYALSGAVLGRWLARHSLARAVQRWVFASLLIGFGLRLALADRLQ